MQRTVTFILLRRLSMYSIMPINWHPWNKCSVGLETSIPEIEKLKAQLPFPREDFSFPRSDSCQTEEKMKIPFYN